MLLRTGLLLLLCVSSASAATLGLFQIQDKEVDGAPVDLQAADATDGAAVAASEEADVATDAQVSDTQASEAPAVDPPLPEIPEVGNPEADKPEEELQPADSEKAEEPDAEVDGPAGAPTAERPAEEVVTQERPSPEHQETKEIRPVETNEKVNEPAVQEEESGWSLNSIRGGFQSMHGYFDSLVELVGGHNGVCQYRCRYGEPPQPRPGYQLPEPNGCSSSLVGFQLDLGIPAMTKCCDQIDVCYDTCGASKYDCDSGFRSCLHDICSDLKKSLGFETKVQACESMADGLFNTVWTLGCRPYMNSQRAACYCVGEERDEL